MPRPTSLNARTAYDAQGTDVVQIALIRVTLPSGAIHRFSTDPTERYSIDPLRYGTTSTWRNDVDDDAETHEFDFIFIQAVLPDDQQNTPLAASLIVQTDNSELAQQIRNSNELTYCDMAVVMSNEPNVILQQYLNLQLTEVSGDSNQIVFTLSSENETQESWPMDRTGRDNFPALYK